MSVDENIQLMRRWFREVWNEGKKQTIFDLLSTDGVGHGQLEDGSELRGPDQFVPLVERIRGAQTRLALLDVLQHRTRDLQR